MLLTHTISTVSLILLQLVLVLFSPLIVRPNGNSEAVIRVRERDNPGWVMDLAPQNEAKMVLMVAREALYLAFILPILVVMRMRTSFPDFYGCELSPDPWAEGVFGDFELEEDDPFFNMPARMRADGPGNQFATMDKVRIKRKHFVGACSEIESNMSDAFAQEQDVVRRGEGSARHHQFIVLNPANQSLDAIGASPGGNCLQVQRKRKRPSKKQIEDEKAKLAGSIFFARLEDSPDRSGQPLNSLLRGMPPTRTYDFRHGHDQDDKEEAKINQSSSSLQD